eukprot:SAG31_NODE_320_length_17748_cov_4.201881_16_plen_347_part_00
MVAMFFQSLERLLEYMKLPQEANRTGATDDSNWPSAGAITFEGASLRYKPDLPLALDGVDLSIMSGEHVGVVGRTGAGKSTLVSLLFRLVEPASGRVLIDGVDTATVGLKRLRSSISCIPQDPIMMSGTVQSNLDPFNEFPPTEVEAALRQVELAPELLEANVLKGGSNFSAGERQALAMGRAVLHSKRIIVMDEPTANIDSQTDKSLQDMLREKFKGKTLLCVAHRLRTVIEMDRIVVMANGKVAEFAAAADLLDDKTSKFSTMVDATGPSSAASLRSAAAQKRLQRVEKIATRLNSREETTRVLEESVLHDASEAKLPEGSHEADSSSLVAESALTQEVGQQKP